MRTHDPLVSMLLKKLARRAGVKVHLEPKWKFAGQIVLPNGKKSYFRNTAVDLNPLGAARVASDKGYASYFMRRMGYPVVPGEQAFYSNEFCKSLGSKRDIHAAWRYAKKLGLPVIVKPNSRLQGIGVSKVHTEKEFYRAARFILEKQDRVMLVQRALTGQDYRLVVLDNEVISAYERIPLAVTGNGRATIRQLLHSLQRSFKRSGRDTVIDPDDFRIAMKLKRQGCTVRTVLAKRERVTLLDNANLSAGGTARDITDVLHSGFKKVAVRVTKDMGLRYCGVDLMVHGDIASPPRKYWILEINDTPGLDHYVTIGKAQKTIVDGLYLKVLYAIKHSRK